MGSGGGHLAWLGTFWVNEELWVEDMSFQVVTIPLVTQETGTELCQKEP